MKSFFPCLILLVFIISITTCSESTPNNNDIGQKSFTILFTSDEHGWLEPGENFGGASGMVAFWKNVEGYTSDGDFLILSSGDMWTGPAISTWFQGESMAEIMNKMEYDASAIGNHEFDFTDSILTVRAQNSTFPFLAANIIETSTGEIPEFTTPYLIKEVNNVKIGIIGLSSLSTPYTTFPDYVKNYSFLPYDEALTKYVPEIKSKDVELIIVIGHLCPNELVSLSNAAKEFGISIMLGGHCHEHFSKVSNGVTLAEVGPNLITYGKIEVFFDDEIDSLLEAKVSFHQNDQIERDPEIEELINFWKSKADGSLAEIIGYTNSEIKDETNEIYNLVTDSWLYSFPNIDVSITNTGGIRQSIPKGNISVETIVGVLPFKNTLLKLELTGDQLISSIDGMVYGGMTSIGGNFLNDGTKIHSDSLYNVLTTDYLYSRDDISFSEYDTIPYNTSVHYRQPLIDWLKSVETSSENPLDNYLDSSPR